MTEQDRTELESILAAFDAHLADEGRAANTRAAYRSDIVQFAEVFGLPSEWKTEMVERFKAASLQRRAAVSTINRKLQSLTQLITYMKTTGCDMNVRIRAVKVQRQDFLQEVISKDDLNRMIGHALQRNDYRAAAIFAGMSKTGARVSELLQFRCCDVHGEKIQVVGKGGKVRFLIVPPTLTPLLVACAGARDGTDQPLFMNSQTGKPLTRQWIDRIIKNYSRQCRVNKKRAHAHSMRHHHAMALRELGITAEDIAKVEGHSSTQTTGIYTQSTEKQLKAKISRL